MVTLATYVTQWCPRIMFCFIYFGAQSGHVAAFVLPKLTKIIDLHVESLCKHCLRVLRRHFSLISQDMRATMIISWSAMPRMPISTRIQCHHWYHYRHRRTHLTQHYRHRHRHHNRRHYDRCRPPQHFDFINLRWIRMHWDTICYGWRVGIA